LTVFCVARAAKNSGICQHQSNSNWLHFILPRSENLWNLPTQKELKIDSIWFCRAARIFWN
jgi:hypothetical protein